ncbi:MAG: hypothetical protein ACREFC_03220 [Stellaceae bacterium]
MKASLAILLAGALLAASPALVFAEEAGQPQQEQQKGGDDFAAKKDAYVKRMHSDMDQWGNKIGKYSADAKAKGDRAAGDADKDLRQAWLKTKEASRKVAHASKKSWSKAKAAFERASDKLNKEWHEHSGQ